MTCNDVTTCKFVAFDFRCVKSVSQLPNNSYNLDKAVALKVGFVLYILPQIREIVLASVVWPILVFHCPRYQHFFNRAILETILLL